MTAAQIQIEETEHERVERWRAEALEKAGYDHDGAVELASHHDVDLHRAGFTVLEHRTLVPTEPFLAVRARRAA